MAPQGIGRLCNKDYVPSESVRAVVDFLTVSVVHKGFCSSDPVRAREIYHIRANVEGQTLRFASL